MKGEELLGYGKKLINVYVYVHVCLYVLTWIHVFVCLIKKHVFMSGMFLSTESSMKGIIFFSSFPIFLGCDSTQRGEGPYSPPGDQN